ncbi:MAG: hypothetical protein FWG51_02515 [Firmicutes bacterium]|nr:hypothetical protein [Bacillota bacterium]
MKKISKLLLIMAIAAICAFGLASCAPSDVIKYNITKAETENGTITVSKDKAEAGTTITITPTPNLGYAVGEVTVYKTGEESTLIEVTGNTFEMPEHDVTVSVTFEALILSITKTSPVDGGFNVSASTATIGTTITILDIEPDDGYGIGEVIVYKTGNISTKILVTNNAGTYTFTMPAYDVTVSVSFEWLYEIAIDTPSNGSVAISLEKAIAGTVVAITAAPDEGYDIAKILYYKTDEPAIEVEVEGGAFEMPEYDVTVSVSFEWLYEIAMGAPSNGSISISLERAMGGTVITVTAAPDEGYDIVKILYYKTDEPAVEAEIEDNTFEMPGYDITVSAVFEAIAFNITKSSSENGSFDVSEETAIVETVITITATPDEGYALREIIVYKTSDIGTTVVTGNTFIMPAFDVTVSVVFDELYIIDADETENGSFELSSESALSGTTVTVTATPGEGYDIVRIFYYKTDEPAIEFEVEGGAFEMPGYDITVSVVFGKLYNINKFVYKNYTVLFPSAVLAGETVTFEVIPDDGYIISSVDVYVMPYSSLVELDEVTDNEDGTYSFIMPEQDVFIWAEVISE